MNTAEKLRFLADRAEDGKEFILQDVEFVFIKNEIYENEQGFPIDLKISQLLNGELELKPDWDFTEDEKVILRNVPEQYKWIARDEIDNQLYVYTDKPTKKNQEWLSGTGSARNFNVFKHLFQSIKLSDEPCEFRKYL